MCGHIPHVAIYAAICVGVSTCVLLHCAVHCCEAYGLLWQCVGGCGGGCGMYGCVLHVQIYVGMCLHVFAVSMGLSVSSVYPCKNAYRGCTKITDKPLNTNQKKKEQKKTAAEKRKKAALPYQRPATATSSANAQSGRPTVLQAVDPSNISRRK